MGHTTKDPEIRKRDDLTVASFSVAVNQRYGDKENTNFFCCTAFRKQAEFIDKYIKKGTKVLVTGRLENDNYTGRDGTKYYSVKIIVEEIEFAESKGKKEDKPAEDWMNIPDNIDEDLPFAF